MEPNADGIGEIAEVTSDVLPGAPVVDDALAALVANGHAEEIIDGDAFDLRHMLQALQAMRVGDCTSEVTRAAREVGTDGKRGGQGQVSEVTGVWRDLTESVNSMASSLTAQVRNIADVTSAGANGDLSKKIAVDVEPDGLQEVAAGHGGNRMGDRGGRP